MLLSLQVTGKKRRLRVTLASSGLKADWLQHTRSYLRWRARLCARAAQQPHLMGEARVWPALKVPGLWFPIPCCRPENEVSPTYLKRWHHSAMVRGEGSTEACPENIFALQLVHYITLAQGGYFGLPSIFTEFNNVTIEKI